MSTDVEEFLSHYGVKGMRWGVVNEDKGSSKPKDQFPISSKFGNKSLKDLRGEQDPNASPSEKRKLSRNQKLLLAGAGAVVLAGAAYGAYKLGETGEYNRILAKGKMFATGKDTPWKKRPDLADPNMSADDIFAKISTKVNPKYGAPGTKANCVRAGFAHELSRRGYDVEATRSLKGTGGHAGGVVSAVTSTGRRLSGKEGKALKEAKELSDFSKIMGAFKPIPVGNDDTSYATNIFKGIASSNPERARGNVNVFWKPGGAHVISYEVINGRTHLFDSQTGRRYSRPAELLEDYGDLVSGVETMRLDNLDMNPNFLTRWVK